MKEKSAVTFVYDPIGNARKARKSGYCYIYISNESDNLVYFDNLTLTHERSSLIDETHYYPFGLVMAGLSGKAALTLENKSRYNGIEQNDAFDLNMYDAFFRNLDPQIGRFWQVDPEAESLSSYSPFASMGNNPISNVDPLGDFSSSFAARWYAMWHGGTVGRNDYGEWYVRQTQSEYSEETGVTVTARIIYGKGRNKYSSYIDDLTNGFDEQNQVDEFTRLGMWDNNLSPNAANQNLINNSIGLSLPNVQIKSTTVRIRSFFKRLFSSRNPTLKPSTQNLTIHSEIVLSGGRNGNLVKNLEGPANSVLKGSEGRIFITDESGKVIWDITKERAKPVIPGQGFGPKMIPTQEQLDLINKVWGGIK